jgi:uncharacterized protein (DUF983 family)
VDPIAEAPALARGPFPLRIPVTRLLSRALRRRCPACGGQPIFLTWTRLCPGCPVCGFQLERGERGYWVGAHFLNLLAVDFAFALWFAGMLAATWPDPPWVLIHLGNFVCVIGTPILFYPWSKTLFLACDIFFRPLEIGDFASRHERALRG